MCFKLFCCNVSGSGTTRRTFEFGRTHVVMPRGKHQATIVWLHGLGDTGSRNVETDCFGFFMENAHAEGNKLLTWKEIVDEIMGNWSQILETFPLPNIKWICPTAPTRSVALFGGFPVTAWFDVGDISEDACDDLEGLDASAEHVANFLSTEPADIKLGVGGFSMGAATALYSATCHVLGQYVSGNLYPVNLSATVGLSGWLPCSRTLRNRMVGLHENTRSAASLPILLCHGIGDDVVAYKHGQKSAQVLSSAGFQNVTFRTYNGLGHYTVPEETNDVCNWLTATLVLEGSQTYQEETVGM